MATQTIDMNDVQTCTFNNQSVSEIYLNSTKIWPVTPGIQYFTIEALGSIELVLRDGFDGSIEYSTDNGTTWNGPIDASMANYSIYGSKILLRGTSNTTFWDNVESRSAIYIGANYDFTVSGDIETLLDYQTVVNGNHPVPANYCFQNLFNGYTHLVDASDLILSYNTSEYCYSSFFNGCSALVNPAQHPAQNVATYAYNSCYYNCISLIKLPSIYAVNVGVSAFRYMFRYCSSIKMSQTQTGEYVNEYRVPPSGTATYGSTPGNNAFQYTSGTYKTALVPNTTYYTSNQVV